MLLQELIWAKSPVSAMLESVSEALPVLVTRTLWAGLCTPTISEGKSSVVGASVRAPAEEATPVPVTVICCGLPAASSEMVIWSVLVPAVVGVKVI